MSIRDVEDWLAMPFPRLGGPLGDFLRYDSLLAGHATRFVRGERIDPAMLPERDTESEQLAGDVRSGVARTTAEELTFLAYWDAMEAARRAMGDHTAGPRAKARIEWPWWRQDVMVSLDYLADPEYQRRVWSGGERDRDDDIDSWDHVVHTLWDDTLVLEDPERTVGTILLPGAELERMSTLAAVWRPLFDDLGPAEAAVFVGDPRWPIMESDLPRDVVEVFRKAGIITFGDLLADGRDLSAFRLSLVDRRRVRRWLDHLRRQAEG